MFVIGSLVSCLITIKINSGFPILSEEYTKGKVLKVLETDLTVDFSEALKGRAFVKSDDYKELLVDKQDCKEIK